MSEFAGFDVETEEEEILEDTPEFEQPEFEYILQGGTGESNLGRKRESTERISKPFLGKLAKARLIAARSGQLYIGAPPLIPPERLRSNEIPEIAQQEFEEGILPIKILRTFADGTYEVWNISEFKYRVRDEGRSQRARQRPFRR